MGGGNLRVWLVIALAFVFSLATAAIILQSLRSIELAAERATSLNDTLRTAKDIRTLLVDAETGQRGYLLTQDSRYLEPLTIAAKRLPELEARFIAQARNDARLQLLHNDLVKLATMRHELNQRTVALAQAQRYKEALALVQTGKGKDLMDQMRDNLAQIEAHLTTSINAARRKRDDEMRWSKLATVGLGALSAALVLGLAVTLASELRRRQEFQQTLAVEVDRLSHSLKQRANELERVSAHLQSTAETEKAKLARELHDEFGGLLTSLKIDSAWLQGKAEALDAGMKERTDVLSTKLDDLIDLKRRVIETLRPSLLDNLGTEAAIEWYASDAAARANVKLELSLDELQRKPSPELSIALYRIVQESLTNTIKYAGASVVRILLKETPDTLSLTIADDGKGMDLSTQPSLTLSHGLEGMKFRTQSLGGEFTLRSAPGEGTLIHASFPHADGT